MKKKGIVIGGIVLICILLGLLIGEGVRNSAAYYYSLAELAEAGQIGQPVRVRGTLVKESICWEPDTPQLRFTVTDGIHQMAMVYAAVMPDNFAHSAEIIAEGRLNADHQFAVSKLMIPCPSKYENAAGNEEE